jgi:hypothetical protein
MILDVPDNFIDMEEDKKLKICYLFWKNLMLARALIGN